MTEDVMTVGDQTDAMIAKVVTRDGEALSKVVVEKELAHEAVAEKIINTMIRYLPGFGTSVVGNKIFIVIILI